MKRLLLFALPILLWSCEEALDSINPLSSEFSATISGSVSTGFSGTSNFIHVKVQSQNPPGSNLTVNMENKDNENELISLGIIESNNGDGIKPGTYDYDPDFAGDLMVTFGYYNDQGAFLYVNPDATNRVIITSVEGTRIKGSFSFTAKDAFEAEVSVTGSFDATGITSTQ